MKMAENGACEQREKELRAVFAGMDEGIRSMIDPLITEAAYLETELNALRALPKIRVHPADLTQQKTTPAAKLYKELLQQYTNCMKLLIIVARRDAPEEESPLRQYLEERRRMNGGT